MYAALSYLEGGGAVEGGGGLKLLVYAALSYLGGGGAVAERPSESKVKVASAFDDL